MINIIIHIGPPKTGTSAIQKWLKDHTDDLKQCGVYYPEHLEDSNGVSSGNLLSIFERTKNDYTFSAQRLEALVKRTIALECNTLLLSSEFFFNRLFKELKSLSNVKMIAYVRNPADLFESHYNQSVKRHGNVSAFKAHIALPMQSIKLLGEYADVLGERFILRAYHDSLFVEGNIVSDFLYALKIPIKNVIKSRRVNNSYCLEALEVKRWFNAYDLRNHSNSLDRVLQAYKYGLSDFTFVNRNQFNDYKRQSIKRIKDLYEQSHFDNGLQLVDLISQQEHSSFCKQEINKSQCEKVFLFIAQKNPNLLKRLALYVYAQPHVKNKSPFAESLFELVPPKEALPNFAEYIKDCLYNRYGLSSPSDVEATPDKKASFREHASCLLQARFSLLAYIKAFIASYQ